MNDKIVIYTAGPIDLAVGVTQWRKELSDFLHTQGYTSVIFDPSTAFKSSNWGDRDLSRSRYIENVNMYALEEATIFMAYVPKSIASVGTPIEIDMAHQLAKPIVMLTDILPGRSAYLDNRVPMSNWVHITLGDSVSMSNGIIEAANIVIAIVKELNKDKHA